MPTVESSPTTPYATKPNRHRVAEGRFRHGRDLRAAAADIRQEYRALPGLSVTAAQAARLWHLDPDSCALVLRQLTGSGFLARAADGRFRLGPCITTGENCVDCAQWAPLGDGMEPVGAP